MNSETQDRENNVCFTGSVHFCDPAVGVIRLISSTVHTLVAIKSLEIFSQGGRPFEQPFSAVEGPKECVRSEISRCGIWPGQRGQQAHAFSRSQREDLERAGGFTRLSVIMTSPALNSELRLYRTELWNPV